MALLSGNHRQADDSDFYSILNRIRVGECTEEDVARINGTSMASRNIPRTHTVLCLRKYQVDEVNDARTG